MIAHRVILLGASNVTLNFPSIAHSLAGSLPGPVEVFAAHGHGRSYCRWSYVLNRGLPGIDKCGLWEALAAQPPAEQTWALVTDVGNDLLYGSLPDELIPHVGGSLQRLQELDAKLLCVRPPIERLLRLTAFKYRVAKGILFPGAGQSWELMRQMALDLDQGFGELASSFGATIVKPQLEWYGVDPIHVRRRERPKAWQAILNSWQGIPRIQVTRPSLGMARQIWMQRPAERSFFSRVVQTPQPSGELSNGTCIWLF